MLEQKEKVKWSGEITKEDVLERIGEDSTFLNNTLPRKANWVRYILRVSSLIYDVIEGNVSEVKGIGRRARLLDDLRNRRRYWELKEEEGDGNWWK